MTHTPGPWEYSGGGIWGSSPFNARVRLADITFHNSINAIDSEANARVMAASPELLAFAVQIAGFSPPGRDALDDAETLATIIGMAQSLCAKAGLTVHPWDPAEDEENEWDDA